MQITRSTDCPYYIISRITLFVTAALKKKFAQAGIAVRPAYLGVLLVLWHEDGLKTIELAKKAGLEPSTMTGLVDRLERDGLVFRALDPNDRRAQQIFLTAEGRAVQGPVLEVVSKTLDQVFAGVQEQELSITMEVLKQVLSNAQEGGR